MNIFELKQWNTETILQSWKQVFLRREHKSKCDLLHSPHASISFFEFQFLFHKKKTKQTQTINRWYNIGSRINETTLRYFMEEMYPTRDTAFTYRWFSGTMPNDNVNRIPDD